MNKISIASPPLVAHNDVKTRLNWKDSASVQRLLDVIASIVADEYMQIAKRNPEMFKKGGQQ